MKNLIQVKELCLALLLVNNGYHISNFPKTTQVNNGRQQIEAGAM